MGARLCPNCGSSRGAATSRGLGPGDFLICARCGSILCLDAETQPVLATEEQLRDPANYVLFKTLEFALWLQQRRPS